MFATQVLPDTLPDEDFQEDNVSEIIGYLIAREKKYEVKKGETKIGRDPSMCSIVIEDFTISKVHAVIESDGIDDTFIYDFGSTNQTKLGKKLLKPHCRYKLDNESKLTLGNVIAKFMLPPDTSSNSVIKADKLNSENLNPLDELGDIFELATQVGTPDTSTSKVPVFEKLSESHCVFKIPTLELPANTKESPKLSKNVFNEVMQCGLDSQKTTSKTVFQNNFLESSNIFNLSTQCQLYESQAQDSKFKEKLNNKGSNKNKEGDKVESLLNDGQDDVLCVFMSLHSPKEQNNEELLKEIKTEVKDLCEVFDAPTQMQPVIIQEPVIKNKAKLEDSRKKDLCNENLGTPSITNNPLICRVKSNQNDISENSSSCTENFEEEDFIKTQDFNVEDTKSKEVSEDGKNLSQNEETQVYLDETLVDQSIIEEKNKNEDLILTQTFEPHESQQNARTTSTILESENINEIEDFMATQIYDVDKEKLRNEFSAKTRTSSQQLSENSDVEHDLDFMVRNTQDDFVATQVFEGAADQKKNNDKIEERDTDDERNNSINEEDFIVTQPIDLPINKTQIIKNAKESRVEKSSRESSPDLLDFENSWKDSEDFINTQLFDVPEHQTSSIKKSSEQTNSLVSSQLNKEKNNFNIGQTKKSITVESSGDETESDLEIILDKTETEKTGECRRKSFKTESECESSIQPRNVEIEENDSNSSYIFDLGPGNHIAKLNNENMNQELRRGSSTSGSDETDCEEIAVVCLRQSVKQELLEKVEFEESHQALTLSMPDNCRARTSDNVWVSGGLEESPKFESGVESGPRSPEPSNAHGAETNNRILENESGVAEDSQIPVKIQKTEVEVSKSGREADSPLKRPSDNKILHVVPIKKSKTEILDRFLKSSEKKLLKLVQAHDIAQIQPSRTRNSVKMFMTENTLNETDASVTNEHPSSRRKANQKKANGKKLNGDITSYLTIKKVETRRTSYKERIKETSSKEPKEKKADPKPVESSSRVLRSSRRSGNAAPSVLNDCLTENISIRRSRRISRTKDEEYFTSSCVNVIFTGFGCESLDKIISELGGKKAYDLSCGEVVVADKVRRTVKFLCAIGLGLPITSPEWLLSSERERKFLNPWNFILKDEESEEKYNFELKSSLERSKKVKLLEGFSIFATKSTKPPVKELMAIVECCGGTPLLSPPDVWPKKTIIVSCIEDKQWWPLPKCRNVKLVHYEFILGGVLRQKIDFKTYKLR